MQSGAPKLGAGPPTTKTTTPTTPTTPALHGMFVVKRDGRTEKVHFDKITSRIKKLCYGLNDSFVDPTIVSQKVCVGVYRGVTTAELDELAAETAAHLTSEHPDYGVLAARISVSNLHKGTSKVWSDVVKLLRDYKEPKTGRPAPMIADNVYEFAVANKEALNSAIVYDRDYMYDYFGFKTLERSYLLKIGGVIAERPQHMLMRVSCGIHCGDLEATIETYNYLSNGWFIHASPTLFNAGTPRPNLASCFLLTMKEDSIEDIYDTLKQCAVISKSAGGIGLAVHNIRATGSYIRGTNGTSNGLVPMLRVFNNTARYVDQGGGKRKGAFAVYLEPWHADIEMWLDLKKNHGIEEARARDLFFGLWIPDLFFKRVESGGNWSLFCPNEAPGLPDHFGQEFEDLYEKYERAGLARKVMKARDLWQTIIDSQIETGTPYMLFKDACNAKSNQKNLGTIRCSNLCTEVVQFTSADEVAVCNLASVALPKFVTEGVFDYAKLNEVVQVMTRNLNKVIDVNYYSLKEAEYSNKRNRPIGIGVQGLADAFIKMRMPFDSDAATKLNKDIFECIYFAALTASKDLAKRLGPYTSYPGSPVSKGVLQFDMWGVAPESKLWDWGALRAEIKQHGVRNSLLVAPMPTASTSQILGNNEAFEPYTSNLYVRRTLAGEFVCVSRHLLSDLIVRGLWTPALKNQLIAHNGSVQKLDIPSELKNLYKTVWEISQRKIIDMAADRGAYIDQSQSLNIHITDPNYGKLTSMHFYAWKKGLKTGMYYLRSKPAVDAIKFTVDQGMLRESDKKHPKSDAKERADITSTPRQTPDIGESKFFKHLSTETARTQDVPTKDILPRDSAVAFFDLSLSSSSSSSSSSPSSSLLTLSSSSSLPSSSSLLPSPSRPPQLFAKSVSQKPFEDVSMLRETAMIPLLVTSSLVSDPGSPSPSPRSAVFSPELAGTSKSNSAIVDLPGADAKLGVSVASIAPLSSSEPPSEPSSEPSVATDIEAWRAERERQKEAMFCSLDNKEACAMCSS